MKVYVDPVPAGLSQAMWRVSRALRETAPSDVKIVKFPNEADVQVLHMIGRDCMSHLTAPRYAVVQYCGGMEAAPDGRNVPITNSPWLPVWRDAVAVWSYYDLCMPAGINYYHAPLGVDGEIFKPSRTPAPRDVGIMTSGYVSGFGAEAIEECALAAARCNFATVHLGPTRIQNMTQYPPRWFAVSAITDRELAGLYRRCRYVSGLRYGEGFELPVLEGLACGARPIVFDRPDMREWYDGHAVFVPECCGDALVDVLSDVLRDEPQPVTPAERDSVLARFDWSTIGRGFWATILARVEVVA
jgi:hypothetical protein